MAKTTAVRMSEQSAADLRKFAYTLSAQLGTRVTLGRALTAAVSMASKDIPGAIAALPEASTDDED